MHMTIQQILREKGLSRYQLSKRSGIPWATLADICSGKTALTRCSAGTLGKLSAALDMDSARAEARKLEDETAQDGFWNDLERSQKVQQRLKQLQNKIARQDKLVTEWQDLTALCEMGQEAEDEELLEELKSGFQTLEEKIEELKENPALADVPAIRDGRITSVTLCESFASSMTGDTIEKFARSFHPDCFQ